MAEEKKKSQIPTNSNLTAAVESAIKEIEEIEKRTKSLKFDAIFASLNQSVLVLTTVQLLVGIIQVLLDLEKQIPIQGPTNGALMNTLSSINMAMNVIALQSSTFNTIVQNMLEILKIDTKKIGEITLVMTGVLQSVTNIVKEVEKSPDAKKAKLLTTGLLNFLMVLSSMVKVMASLVLASPILTTFVTMEPVIISAMNVAMRLLTDLSVLASYTLKRSIALKLFGFTSKLLVGAMKRLITIIVHINRMSKFVNIGQIKNLSKIWVITYLLSGIFDNIHSIRVFLLNRHLKAIFRAVNYLNGIIIRLGRLKGNRVMRALKNVFIFKLVIQQLTLLLLSIMVLTPIAIVFLVLSPVIIGAVWLLAKTINTIGNIFNKGIKKRAIIGLKKMAWVAILLSGIASALLILALAASVMTKSGMLAILGFMGMLLLFTVVIGVFVRIAAKAVSRRTSRIIKRIAMVTLSLAIIALTLIVLAPLAMLVMKGILPILGFMIFLIGFSFLLKVVAIVIRIFANKRTLKRFWIIAKIILTLILITALLMILAVGAAMLANLIMPILGFMLFMIGFLIVLKVFAWIMSKVIKMKVLFGLILMIGIIMLLFVNAIMLMMLSTLTDSLMDKLGDLLTFAMFMIGAVVVLGIFGKIIGKVMGYFIQAIIGLALIIVVIGLLFVVSIMLLLITKMATEVVSNYGDLMLYLLGLIPVILIISAIGFLAFMAIPVLVPAIVGLVILLIVVGLLWVISLLLSSIAEMDLDFDKIRETISNIFDTVKFILTGLFENNADDSESSDKGFIETVVGYIGSGLATIITAIMSIAFLALAIFAILMVLILAAQLRLLQEIDLDPTAILNNIEIVLSTSQAVADAIYDRQDDKDNASNKSFMSKIFGFLGLDKLAEIIDAIFSIAFLALSVIAISLIVFLAALLRLLQEIALEPGKIQLNVDVVINTALTVADSIYDRKDDKNNPSKKGFMGKIFGFLGLDKLAKIVDSLFSIAFLALSVIAISLIVFIAKQLELLLELKLEPGKIQLNVNLVIDTAQMVVNNLFDRKDDKKSESKKLGILGGLLSFISPQMSQILDGIFAIAFLALTLVSITLITYIADQLNKLLELQLDPNQIQINVDTVINTARMVADAIYDEPDKDETKSNKGIMGSLIEFIDPNLGKVMNSLFTIAFLALTVISIKIVSLIATELEKLLKIKLDTNKVISTVKTVIKAAKAVNSSIYDEPDMPTKKGSSIFRKLLEWVLPDPLLDMIDSMMAIGFLSQALVAVGLVGKLAENLTTINKIPDLSSSYDKTIEVIRASKNVMAAVYNQGGSIELNEKDELEHYSRVVRRLTEGRDVINHIGFFVNRVNDLTKFKLPDSLIIETKINEVFSVIRSVQKQSVDEIQFTSKLKCVQNLQKIFNSFNVTDSTVTNTKLIAEDTIKVLDKIGGTDIEKLKTAERIFKNMSEFSKSISGNFDALADSLNEKIAPLMEELKKVMEEVPEHIKQSTQSITSAVGNTGKMLQGIETDEDIKKRILRDQPNIDQKALQEKIKSERTRIDENSMSGEAAQLILRLLKSGSGKIKIVK